MRKTHPSPMRPGVGTARGRVPWDEADSTLVEEHLYDERPPEVRDRLKRKRRAIDVETEAAIDKMKAELPPVVKTTPQEKLKDISDRLLGEAERTYKLFGHVVLPASIMEEVWGPMWELGIPLDADTKTALEDLARRTLEKAVREYGTDRPPEINP